MIISFVFTLTSCEPDIEPVKYFFPNNYIGWAFIVHNTVGGIKEKDRNTRIYNIPSNGILFSGFEPNYGWQSNGDIQYYYKTDSSSIRLLAYEDIVFDTVLKNKFMNKNLNKIIGSCSSNIGMNNYTIDGVFIDTFKNINNEKYISIPKTIIKVLDSLVSANYIKFDNKDSDSKLVK